jgi:hypothetical protein
VKVEGGKGNVIGDFATVVQVFKDAPAPLSSQIRTREFAGLIEERTRRFVGREYVFAAARAALADADFPCGYVVLQGEPGIGKTALMAELVKREGYVHHFNVAPMGIRSPQAFLANVCAQLIVRYGLEHSSLPPEATQDGGFLARLLGEAADDAANLPIVVVVDALDEAEDVGLPPGANRLFLPPSLPTGVYFVVSTRELQDHRLSVDGRRNLYLRDDDLRNLDDVGAFVREYVAANRERMTPRLAQWDLGSDGFAELLVAKSAGNFMYLVHVLRDIASGALTAETVDDIRNLPEGLKAYYQRHWSEMKSADREHFRRYQQPVVCLLATAREPVSIVELLEWTEGFWKREGWDRSDLDAIAVKDVLGAWREFLHEDRPPGEPARYRVYHASFQDFLAEEVGLAIYHQTIANTALAKIPGFFDGL